MEGVELGNILLYWNEGKIRRFPNIIHDEFERGSQTLCQIRKIEA